MVNYGAPRARIYDKIEVAYLKALRAIVLLIATVLIAVTLWLGVSSLYKMSRSTDSVKEVPASVSADDIANTGKADAKQVEQQSKLAASPEQVKYINDFVGRYYALFENDFEKYRHFDDRAITKDEFDGLFVRSTDHLSGIGDGSIDFAKDKADLERLISVMTEAAQKSGTHDILIRYQRSVKQSVTRDVRRTRFGLKRGWDSGSVSCPSWYSPPIGCPTSRVVEIPYTERLTSMEYPSGTIPPIDLFRSFQQHYWDLLGSRRNANAQEAQAERDAIALGNVQGRAALVLAFEVLGAFVALMFFFLLIAIERHQRRIASQIGNTLITETSPQGD